MAASPDHSDACLVSAIMSGDRRAFEMIYRKYISVLYRYVRKNVPRKEDCEEILQEVFVSLWERREHLQIQSSLKGYLLGMVRYKIIHHFRKSALKRKYTEHFLIFEAVYWQAGEAEQDNSVIDSALDALISELPERCQEALRLRLSEGLSNPDIAERMKITTRTVEAYMFRAFNHIRASYKTYADH